MRKSIERWDHQQCGSSRSLRSLAKGLQGTVLQAEIEQVKAVGPKVNVFWLQFWLTKFS